MSVLFKNATFSRIIMILNKLGYKNYLSLIAENISSWHSGSFYKTGLNFKRPGGQKQILCCELFSIIIADGLLTVELKMRSRSRGPIDPCYFNIFLFSAFSVYLLLCITLSFYSSTKPFSNGMMQRGRN